MPRALRLILAAGAGLAAAFVGLELILQIASVFAPAARVASLPESDPTIPRVLFAGDSHIYGLFAKDHQTLPAAAERIARESCPPGFVSINLGRAGSTSWIAAAEAKRALAEMRPAALVLRVGINNGIAVRPEAAGWWEQLRTVRLLRIAAMRARGTDSSNANKLGVGVLRGSEPRPAAGGVRATDVLIAEFDRAGEANYNWDAIAAGLKEDILEVAASARGARCAFIVLSYLDPTGAFPPVNAALERAAAAGGATFVNLSTIGAAIPALGRRDDVFFGDGHPTYVGYEIEARALVREMLKRGLLSGAPPQDPLEWYQSARNKLPEPAPTTKPEVEIQRLGSGELLFRVRAAPGRSGWLWVGRAGAGFAFDRYHVPIDLEDCAASAELPGFRYKTDASGLAEAVLRADLLKLMPLGGLCAAVVEDTSAPAVKYYISNLLDIATGAAAPQQVRVTR